MKRVAIFGSPGSGKSTLARQLSARTGLEAFHLDRYYFGPNWVIKPEDEFVASVVGVVARDSWITDGNYIRESQAAGRIDRADTLILLRCGRMTCLWRVIRRVLTNYGKVRPDQAVGCPERLDWDFLQFVWNYPAKAKQIQQLLNAQAATKTVLTLSRVSQINRFLATVQADANG